MLKDYEALVPSYYLDKPRTMERLRSVLKQVVELGDLVSSFVTEFSIDDAVGAQLDVIGSLVGADRILPFAPTSAGRRLDDDNYRLIIRARIAMNTWDGTNENAISMFSTIFPSFGVVLQDKQDMSINVVLRGTFSQLQLEMINAGLLITRPAGVKMTYEVPETIISTDVIVQLGIYQAGQIAFTPR